MTKGTDSLGSSPGYQTHRNLRDAFALETKWDL